MVDFGDVLITSDPSKALVPLWRWMGVHPDGDQAPERRTIALTNGRIFLAPSDAWGSGRTRLAGIVVATTCYHDGLPGLLAPPANQQPVDVNPTKPTSAELHSHNHRAIEAITLVHPDPAGLHPKLSQHPTIRRYWEGAGRLEVAIGSGLLRYLSPARFARRYPGVDVPQPLPAAMVLTVRVACIAQARHSWAAHGISTLPVAGSRLVAAPSLAGDVVVELVDP